MARTPLGPGWVVQDERRRWEDRATELEESRHRRRRTGDPPPLGRGDRLRGDLDGPGVVARARSQRLCAAGRPADGHVPAIRPRRAVARDVGPRAPPMGRLWIVPAAVFAILPAVSLVGAIVYRQWIIGELDAGRPRGLGRGGLRLDAPPAIGAAAVPDVPAHGRRDGDRPGDRRPGGGRDRPAAAAADGIPRLPAVFPRVLRPRRGLVPGALDAHLHRPGERFHFTSALLGSLLWGLWHLPTLPAESRGPEAVIALLGVHVLIGVPLAIYWRQSGNLAVPAFTHAMIDAVRNAFASRGDGRGSVPSAIIDESDRAGIAHGSRACSGQRRESMPTKTWACHPSTAPERSDDMPPSRPRRGGG